MKPWFTCLFAAFGLTLGGAAQVPVTSKPASRPATKPTSRPAELPGSPADTGTFQALNKDFDKALRAANRLQQKRRQGERLSDAEKRELAFQQKQIKDLSLAIIKLLAPPRKQEKLAPAPARPLAPAEQKLLKAADTLARATLDPSKIPHLGRARDVVYRDTTLIDHPCLVALPGFRFYVAKIEITPELPARRPARRPARMAGKKKIKPPQRFQYQLVAYDRTKQTVRHYYGFGAQHVVRPLLESGRIRVRDRAAAERIPAAMALLLRASRGVNVFRSGTTGLSRAELDKCLSLGRCSGAVKAPPARVVETDKQRVLVLYRLWASDWNMPLQLRFELFRFDLASGRFLGRDHRRHKERFPSTSKVDDERVRRVVDALAEELQAEHRSR